MRGGFDRSDARKSGCATNDETRIEGRGEATHRETMREEYARRMLEIRRGFDADGEGLRAAEARRSWWMIWCDGCGRPRKRRRRRASRVSRWWRWVGTEARQLFPCSDIDLMFCVEKGDAPKDAIRRVTQALWDCGLSVSPVTRMLGECERFDANNAEFGHVAAGPADGCRATRRCLQKLDGRIRGEADCEGREGHARGAA